MRLASVGQAVVGVMLLVTAAHAQPEEPAAPAQGSDVADDPADTEVSAPAPPADDAPELEAAGVENPPPEEPPVDPIAAAAPQPEQPPPVAPPPDQSESQDFEEADEPNGYTGPFSQGSIGLTIFLGSASVGDGDYLILGAGVSYFVLNGLALGLNWDIWLLEDPTINTLTPEVRYVLYFVPVVKPYVGVFYRHYFVGEGFEDLDSIGGRVGAYLVTGSGSYLGLGALYEQFLDCEDGVFRDCGDWYPEITLGISF